MNKLRGYLLIVLASWGLVLMPADAMAYQLLYCNTNGTVGGGELFYASPGSNNSFCQYNANNDPTLDHIFSQVACGFTEIINDVLGKMYCGMQAVLKPVVATLLSLYIMIFGVQILMGTAQLTSKEVLTRLFKLSLVWTFISESTLAINMVFRFFLDLANLGVWWAISAIESATFHSGYDPPFHMYHSPFGGLGDVMPAYTYIDTLIKQVVMGPFMAANSELVVFFALMGAFQFPIFMIALYWLITTFKILARTLISFLMAISALAFLIALSPIFLSMMLFRATYQFFESWLKFIISYALQIAIVFACVALWAMAIMQFTGGLNSPPCSGFFGELSCVIFPSRKVEVVAAPTAMPSDSLGVCPYKMTMPSSSTNMMPHIECNDPTFNPVAPPNATPQQKAKAAADKAKIILLSNLNQEKTEDPYQGATQTALNALVYYLFYYLISLIIVCYAFDALLRKAPEIARQLAGPEYVPILGQGYGYIGYGQPGKGGVRQAFDRGHDTQGAGFLNAGRSSSANYGGQAAGDLLRQQNRLVESRGRK
jgi:hypothetical protein